MGFVLQVIGWVFFLYGFIRLFQDIVNDFIYQRLIRNMKVIVLAEDVDKDTYIMIV